MIVVTAPTGKIGSQVLSNLLQQDEDVRVIVRDASRLTADVRDRVDVVVGSHRDSDVVDRAFEGADSLFWLVPADRTARSVYDAYVSFSIPAADAIVRHAVPRVVTISALGRGTQQYAGHISASFAMEDLLRSTGAHLRALTMPSFMDNILFQLRSIKSDGVISGTLPADLKLPLAATRDIAAVASGLLLDHTWTGQDSLGVLGPEDLSSNDVASILTEVLGAAIRFEKGNRETDKQSFVSYGYSDAMAQSMIDMDVAKERGIDNFLARTPENTTPTSLRRWATEELKPALDAA
ncbi:MAG TPA: NAD(P)H-binding protein [Galbitalea sp.]